MSSISLDSRLHFIQDQIIKQFGIGNNYRLIIKESDSELQHVHIENTGEDCVAFGLIGASITPSQLIDLSTSEYINVSLFFSYDFEKEKFNVYRKSFWDSTLSRITNPPKFTTLEVQDLKSILTAIPLGNNLENVLFEAHSHLRDIDGLHADSALDEICKILFAKLYDEKQEVHRFRSNYSCVDETAAVIRNLYNKAVYKTLKNNSGHVQQASSVFYDGIKISSTALNKVVSEFEAIDLSNSPVDIKGRAFQNLISPATRSGMGQYFTPKEVIELIVKCIAPSSDETVIDPFCGSAHFLSESANRLSKHEGNNFDLETYVSKKLVGIDKSERMIRVGLTDMLLMEGAAPSLINKDSLLSFEALPNIKESDFDIVMTNPPFGSVLGKEAFDSLGKFTMLTGKSSLPLEIAGLERSIQLLGEKGRMAIVLPDSVLLNKNLGYVRDWLSSNTKLKAIISLPPETFSPFGANVKTSVVILVKEKIESPYDIFMASVENIGYDASGRRSKTDSDLNNVAAEFANFIKKEGW